MKPRLRVSIDAMREYFVHDLGYLRGPATHAAWTSARALILAPSADFRAEGYRLLMRLHRAGLSDSLDRPIAAVLADALAREARGIATGLGQLFDRTIASAVARFRGKFGPDPTRLLGTRILAVKAARSGERGVLVVDYEYVLPLI